MFRVLFFLSLPVLLAGQTSRDFPCSAPEEIRKALREAVKEEPDAAGRQLTFEERRAKGIERLKALASQYPGDFWIQRTYLLTLVAGVRAPDEVVQSFEAKRNSSPQAEFIYALALVGKDTPRAIGILTQLTEKQPAFPDPWMHLSMIDSYPNFNDPQKAQKYAEAYVDRCPESVDAAPLAIKLDKSEKLEHFTKALRERIAGKEDVETVNQYSQLWALEFKLAPANQQPELRKRVAEDVKFLETLDREKFKMADYLLRQGYRLTGDKQGEAKLAAEAKPQDSALPAFFNALNEWNQKNRLSIRATPEEKTAHYRKFLSFLDEWIDKLPYHQAVRIQRLRALSEIPETSGEVLIAEGEKALEAVRKSDRRFFSVPPMEVQIADIWVSHDIALDRAVELVEEGIAGIEKQQQRRAAMMGRSDLFAGDDQRLIDDYNRWYANAAAWRIQAAVYLKTRQIAKARAVLAKWDSALDDRRKKADEIRKRRDSDQETETAAGPLGSPAGRSRMFEENLLRNLPLAEGEYFEALAALAVAENRKLDALTFYQSAIRSMASMRPASEIAYIEPGPNAMALWKELGGTQEGWQEWLATLKPSGTAPPPMPAFSRWVPLARVLPEFELADQSGKTWTLANLKGKTTLINVWATWCSPCRAELPFLQELHDQIKEREDIQVITFNIDENIGWIEPYLMENHFTFPVLAAKPFVDGFTGPIGIPKTWIAGHDGKLRRETGGFGSSGEDWIKTTLAEIEKVRQLE